MLTLIEALLFMVFLELEKQMTKAPKTPEFVGRHLVSRQKKPEECATSDVRMAASTKKMDGMDLNSNDTDCNL